MVLRTTGHAPAIWKSHTHCIAAAAADDDDGGDDHVMHLQVGRRHSSRDDERAIFLRREMTLSLVSSISSPLCFDQLRTKDTLGYTVSCFATCQFGDGEVGWLCCFSACSTGV